MNLNTKRWQPWTIVVLLIALLEISSWGSTNAAASSPPATEGNRFLLILETSKTMQRLGEAAQTAIDELLSSGMHGQLRPGDTIGLWTYTDQLYTGRLPVQDWTPKNAKEVRERILKFITEQKFEKTGDLKKVLPMVARVVKDSEFVTVIFVSSGEEDIAGTPYDSQINEYYRTWRERQRKDFKPFVTVFRGERGKLTRYAVCPVPWPIEIPPLSPERVASQLAQHKTDPALVKKAAPPIGKPLIVMGSSRKAESVEAAKPAPVAIPIPQPPAQGVSKDPRLETAEAIAARLLAESGQSTLITPPLKVVTFHGSSSNSVTPVTATTDTNAIATVVSRPQTPVAEETSVRSNSSPKPTPRALPATAVSSTSSVLVRTAEPAPIVITKAEPVQPKTEQVKDSTVDLASTQSPISETPTTVTKETATSTPSESFLARKGVQRAAMALAAGALACLFIAVRRPRAGYQPSIITRSLERDSR